MPWVSTELFCIYLAVRKNIFTPESGNFWEILGKQMEYLKDITHSA